MTTKRPKTIVVRIPGPNGTTTQQQVEVAARAPIRIGCYTMAERMTILELSFLMFTKKYPGLGHLQLKSAFSGQLRVHQCTALRGGPGFVVGISDLLKGMLEMRLLGRPHTDKRTYEAPITITKKGERHIKRQSVRLQRAAQKLVYTDVLERMAMI